jgi:1-acyl-sn-glycerol-3-phosphate acyltransferase
VWIDRKDTAKAVKTMEAACESLKQRPRSVLIFPEGTRTPTGELQEFKKGGFVLAIQARQRPALWPAARVALPRTGVHAPADI